MIFRDARRDEVARIVALLADDELGAGRETGVDDAYLRAFDDIAADPRSRLIVANVDGQVADTFQLTVLPGLSRHGMRRRRSRASGSRRRGGATGWAGRCPGGRSRRPARTAAALSS